MRFQRVEPGGDADLAVDFHRQVTVVQGLTGPDRERFIEALAGIVSGEVDGTAGVIEAQGIEFGIDTDAVTLLELQTPVDIVLRADQLPERNEDAQELSARLDRAIAMREEMSGRLEAMRLDHRVLSSERDALVGELDEEDAGRGPLGRGHVGEDQVAGDRLVGEQADQALALADRWEQLEAQLTAAAPLQTRRSSRSQSPAEVQDAALAAARLAVEQARRAIDETEVGGGRTRPSAADGEALELAHNTVNKLREKAGALFGGGRARRRLEAAEAREHEILDRLGFASYAEFVISSSTTSSLPSEPGAREVGVAALVEAEAALATCEERAAPSDPPSAEPVTTDVPRDELVAQLSELRREVGTVLGRVPGPFPAAELRAATSLSPRPVGSEAAPDAAEPEWFAVEDADAGPDLDPSDPLVDEQTQRLREVTNAMRSAEVRMWILGLEAAAIHDRVVDLEKAVQAVQAAPPSKEEDRSAAWDAVEWYVLARMSALRRISVAGSVPFVLDDPFAVLGREDKVRLAEGLSRMAEIVQVVIVSDDPDVGAWATEAGPHRAAVVAVSNGSHR